VKENLFEIFVQIYIVETYDVLIDTLVVETVHGGSLAANQNVYINDTIGVLIHSLSYAILESVTVIDIRSLYSLLHLCFLRLSYTYKQHLEEVALKVLVQML
jgi:hypothetical protein